MQEVESMQEIPPAVQRFRDGENRQVEPKNHGNPRSGGRACQLQEAKNMIELLKKDLVTHKEEALQN